MSKGVKIAIQLLLTIGACIFSNIVIEDDVIEKLKEKN